LLLYAADRAQHVQERVRPALQAGHWVLCDRFSGSTAAYQGYGRGLSLELIDQLTLVATGGLQPDLTVLLEIPLEESLRRRGHRTADRIEAAGEAFLARVCAGFAALAAQGGWRRLDACRRPDAVTADLQAAITALVAAPPGQG
jgi:dTMP kinase